MRVVKPEIAFADDLARPQVDHFHGPQAAQLLELHHRSDDGGQVRQHGGDIFLGDRQDGIGRAG